MMCSKHLCILHLLLALKSHGLQETTCTCLHIKFVCSTWVLPTVIPTCNCKMSDADTASVLQSDAIVGIRVTAQATVGNPKRHTPRRRASPRARTNNTERKHTNKAPCCASFILCQERKTARAKTGNNLRCRFSGSDSPKPRNKTAGSIEGFSLLLHIPCRQHQSGRSVGQSPRPQQGQLGHLSCGQRHSQQSRSHQLQTETFYLT